MSNKLELLNCYIAKLLPAFVDPLSANNVTIISVLFIK